MYEPSSETALIAEVWMVGFLIPANLPAPRSSTVTLRAAMPRPRLLLRGVAVVDRPTVGAFATGASTTYAHEGS